MAQRPLSDEELIDKYGPHLNEAPPGGWDAGSALARWRSSRMSTEVMDYL